MTDPLTLAEAMAHIEHLETQVGHLRETIRRSVDDFAAVFGHNELDTTCYRITLPHFALSGDNIPLEYHRGRRLYRVVQRETPGLSWEAFGPSTITATLALIAKRAGYDATFEWTPDMAESDRPDGDQ